MAEGECRTCSIGFRAPDDAEVVREILQRLLETDTADETAKRYRDPQQTATDAPGRVPAALQAFAGNAVEAVLRDPTALACMLGEWLSEPKPQVWFDDDASTQPPTDVRLDPRSRMLYDDDHVFLNGESYRASGRDAALMRRLADARSLDVAALSGLSAGARELVMGWLQSGWLQRVKMSP